MSAVDLDRQEIERRDFPIVRRGYDPASVDAHLRALSADVEQLQREASSRGQESLASVAGTQVQGILEAAQTSAMEIERAAAEAAQRVRDEANAEALRTREDTIARAQAHVAAVAQAAEALLARVGTMDNETRTLIDSLRSGASRLVGDLESVEREMGELYDAAGGHAAGGHVGGDHVGGEGDSELGSSRTAAAMYASLAPSAVQESFAAAAAPVEPEPSHNGGVQPVAGGHLDEPATVLSLQSEETEFEQELASTTATTGEDLDGARLVALNMALNGDSREATGQYLAENFEIADRERLLDEVYAAIEG
jgi:DivIVA domain-containing protein